MYPIMHTIKVILEFTKKCDPQKCPIYVLARPSYTTCKASCHDPRKTLATFALYTKRTSQVTISVPRNHLYNPIQPSKHNI